MTRAPAPAASPGAAARPRAVPPAVAHVDVVVPTLGRSSLPDLVDALCRALPGHSDVVVVDDRDGDPPPLDVGPIGGRLRVVRSGGRGPAAARNAGWRASRAPWVAFVDDDVDLPSDWVRGLIRDLREAPADVAAVQGRVEVPLPPGRRPTDWERNVAGLDGAAWITADMAVRRPALEEVGGFDERFTRAYREDTDLALRLLDAGWRLRVGERRVRHPVRPAPWWVSVTLQRGNADDVLLERLHGRAWRERIDAAGDGTGPRRGAWHTYPLTSVLGAAAVVALAAGRPRLAVAAGAAWAVRTGRFAWQRIGPGPRHPAEIAAMVATSAAIPPVACYQRARGLARWRAAQPRPAGSPER